MTDLIFLTVFSPLEGESVIHQLISQSFQSQQFSFSSQLFLLLGNAHLFWVVPSFSSLKKTSGSVKRTDTVPSRAGQGTMDLCQAGPRAAFWPSLASEVMVPCLTLHRCLHLVKARSSFSWFGHSLGVLPVDLPVLCA